MIMRSNLVNGGSRSAAAAGSISAAAKFGLGSFAAGTLGALRVGAGTIGEGRGGSGVIASRLG